MGNGEICNVGVVDSYLQGAIHVGGICGYNYNGEIVNCYNISKVSGDGNVGGICGYNDGVIANCYNNTAVYDGNAVGVNYYRNTSINKTDEQFKSGEVAYLLSEGDKVYGIFSDGSVWGQTIGEDNYPVCSGKKVYATKGCITYNNTGDESEKAHDFGEDGICKVCHAYKISNETELFDFAQYVNSENTLADAVLLADITVSEDKSWTPMGNNNNPYIGRFDGNGHTISGLKFNDTGKDYVGLFGYVGYGGEIADVGVVNCDFKGYSYIGGICGYNYEGTITGCYNTGAVSGEGKDVGGVCGDNYDGVIKNCYNNSDAFGGDPVGDDDDCGAINKTGQQFKSGEVAYLLSEGCVIDGRLYNGSLWGQAIGEDEYPVLNGEKVYSTKGCITYNNTGDESKKAHDFGEDGICKVCHSYKISNENELFTFAQYVNSGNTSANAVLLTDITVSEDKIWTPMGDHVNPYIGRFDGDGHTISGLKFNDTDKNYVGLFEDVGYGGKITGVGVVNSNFTGNGYVGAISGVNGGTIANCYNKSTVGGNYDVGGICGYNDGIVAGSYNAGSVSGDYAIGGICGYNDSFGEIVNCYNNTDAFGGNAVGYIYNSVYAINKTAEEFNSGEVAYLLSEGCYANGKFFEGLVWGQTIGEDDTPVFNGKKVYATKGCVTYNNTGDESEKNHDFGEDGICKVCHSYKISNEDELFAFAQYVNSGNTSADAVLMADITVTEHDSWTPIGNSNKPYSGKFDGNGHTISGLKFNDTEKDYVGLFGYVGYGGKITSVGVIESSFIGDDYVGGICGYNEGTITDSYNTGSVSGEYEDVGGICGYNEGTITNCYYNKDICTIGGIEGRDEAGSAEGLTTLQMIAPDALTVMGFGLAWSKKPADKEDKKAFYPYLAVFEDDAPAVTYEAELTITNTDTAPVYGDELHFILAAKVKYGNMSGYISVMGECEAEDFRIYLEDDSIVTATVSNGAATAVISDSINAGNHTLTLKYAGSDYDFNGVTGNCQVTISKKDALEVAEPTVSSTISYGQSLSDVTFSDNSWSWADKKIIPTVKNNGYVAVTTVDDKNYDYEDIDGYDSATHTVTKNIGVTVNKAVPTIAVTTNPVSDTAGKTVNVTVTVKNPNNAELTDLPEATLTYRVGNGQEKTITGGSFVIPEDAAKGTIITITATTAATDNYAAGKVTVSAKASSLLGIQENEPFIEGDEGKAGWDVISDEIKSAEDGDKIIVDMNGGTELPKNIVSDIKGKDIDLVLDMGNGFTWTINGKTVTDPKSVDMGISKGSDIPVKVINNLTGECQYTTVTLAHNGDFGFKAVLTVDMGRENHGAYANLYYYNKNGNATEFISSGLIGNDGNAKLSFTHASEYIIVIDEHDHGVKKDVDTGDKFAASRMNILFALAALSAAGFTVAYKKRKNKLV